MLLASTQNTQAANPMMQFFSEYGLMILLVVLIIFMFWSSRRRAAKVKAEQAAKAKAMLPGTKVLLQGGFYGILTEYDGEDLSKSARVELAPGLEVEVHSQSILRVVDDESDTLTEDEYIDAEAHHDEYVADVEQGLVSSISDDAKNTHAAEAVKPADASPDAEDQPKA